MEDLSVALPFEFMNEWMNEYINKINVCHNFQTFLYYYVIDLYVNGIVAREHAQYDLSHLEFIETCFSVCYVASLSVFGLFPNNVYYLVTSFFVPEVTEIFCFLTD